MPRAFFTYMEIAIGSRVDRLAQLIVANFPLGLDLRLSVRNLKLFSMIRAVHKKAMTVKSSLLID
jgi:hypothetical protein